MTSASSSLLSRPGVPRLLGLSIIARLPLAMLSLGLLVHVQKASGSFAEAGIVAGVFAVALGVGGPLLGRLVDRRGQLPVLLGASAVAAASLVAIALLPADTPLAARLLLAATLGFAMPPVGACLRALLPDLVGPRAGALRAAYATEASAIELTFIAGPPLILAAGALWSTGAALVATALLLTLATVGFALQPAARHWRPAPELQRPRGGSLSSPALRVLVAVLALVGIVFGAVEVGVTAAAEALGNTAAAGPLLACWGAGSLVGGLIAARRGGGGEPGGLVLILAALALGHLALALATGSALALGVLLAVAGASIAPTYAIVYALVDRAAPRGTATEAFAWLGTATAVGASIGAALAGSLADSAGPSSTFVLAGVAGVAASLAAVRLYAGFLERLQIS